MLDGLGKVLRDCPPDLVADIAESGIMMVGGSALLRAVAGPLPQLRFCPTGGITPVTAPDFLALPNVGCVGGSWLTPADVLAAGEWGHVTDAARYCRSLRPAT